MSDPVAETLVHPTAVVFPGAELGAGVQVGPFCVIEPGVELGAGCILAAHVHLLGRTSIGPGTVIGTGSVIGGPPQDGKYKGERTITRVGAGCTLFEHVTVQRATGEGNATIVGDRVMMMVNSHVGHNARVDDGAVLVNGAALAGHSHVGARAFLSLGCGVHQFCRVGRLTLLGGGTMVTKDAPPFSIITGSYPTRWRAPNTIGMRRAGFAPAERDAVRNALNRIFRSGESPRAIAEELSNNPVAAVAELAAFILSSKRGVVAGPARASAPEDEGIDA
ncbi:MAG: acyl-ACP--UDP-N-acetylglucosamine O-acyltransferase [Planctomycetota bacterium]|nr:MAG: acyl-ACP--UDP-N-acetylglucosamine O-acyltransferase [Planctomycetota bacterium]